MSTAAGSRPVLEIGDLIVAEGRVGEERILVPGLDLVVSAGETVAVVGAPESASALLEVCAGKRRPQYGTVRKGAPDEVVVVDGRVGGGDVSAAERLHETVRRHAGRGTAVLVVAEDQAVIGDWADREVPLGRRVAVRPAAEAVLFERQDLMDAVVGSLVAADVEPGRAGLVARVLVDADVRGHFSHGVGLLPMYLDRLARGGISPGAEPEWVSDSGAVAVLDAGGGFGQVAAELAADACARKATEAGVSAVAVRGNNHIGMLAAYRRHFTERGVVGLIFNISGPGVAAPGAGRATLGNDAVCMVVPRGGADPLIVDFATGTVASGKIRHAAHRGVRVPEGWLVDRQGRPTTDPEELDRGGAVPVFGGHKGLGVALITEILAGVLGGGTISPRVHKQRAEPERVMDCSQLFIALDPAAFGDPPVDELVDALCAAVSSGYPGRPPAVHLPEQQERAAELRASQHGIAVPASVVAALGWQRETDTAPERELAREHARDHAMAGGAR